MVGRLNIMLVALPAMAASFYGTHNVMQKTAPITAAPQMARQATPSPEVNALLVGESIFSKNKSPSKNNFTALSTQSEASFLGAGRTDRADFMKPVTLAKIKLKVEPKAAPIQAAKLAIPQHVAEITPVVIDEPKNNVVASSESQKPVVIAAATSADPYIDEIAPNDVNRSILYQASTQNSWADALVTSAFKAYGPKPTIAKKEVIKPREMAITPRILPSGRAFGGFTEGEFQKRELRCMATGLYFEARSEPIRGQLAVGQVIMNRVRSPDYPDTICGVIFQGDHRNTGCQFSFACDGKTDRPTNAGLWRRSQKLATDLTKGKVWLKDIANSTHYHADYVHPKWRRAMRRLKKIGRHIFYKSPNISTTNTFQAVRS